VENPAACAAINSLGTRTVLEECERAGVRRFCFSSSAAIYGERPESPKTESLPPDPRSPYAVSKLDGERHCAAFLRAGRLSTVSLRYFNVYGPGQDPRGPYAAAVPAFIRGALAGRDLTIFGDGGQTRDFVHVRDIASANIFLAARPDLTGAFNVGRGSAVSVLDLAHAVLRATDSKSGIVYAPPRPGDVRHSTADCARLRAAGFAAAQTLDSGLADTVEWFRGNEG
jgi:UDP-glucose 4-epimerase